MKKIIAAVSIAALAAVSCSLKEDAVQSPSSIRFTTNLENYGTKATDSAFETGDAVSLFAFGSMYVNNVKLTFDGSNLVPEQDIMWEENTPASEGAYFCGVYPYRQDWQGQSNLNVFSVNPDQSTSEQYYASDIMFAFYYAFPDCQTVPLNFTHAMARIQVNITSLNGDVAEDVYITGIRGKCRLRIDEYCRVNSVGQLGTIRMGRRDGGNTGADVFAAIVPPQGPNFKIVVSGRSGRLYSFRHNPDLYLEEANNYVFNLSLEDNLSDDEIPAGITEWTADPDEAFGRYVADEFRTEGRWNIYLVKDYSQDRRLVRLLDQYNYGTGFKTDGETKYAFAYTVCNRTTMYGVGEKTEDGTWQLIPDGDYLQVAETGDMAFTVNSKELTVNVRPDDDVWSVKGIFADGQQEETELDMTWVKYGVYSIDLDFESGGFMFRLNHEYEKYFGWTGYSYEDYRDQSATIYPLSYNGGSWINLPGPGRYRLQLEVNESLVRVKPLNQ